jgi:FtsP/CotA-like multicopper oxidase with cupredoxin domain
MRSSVCVGAVAAAAVIAVAGCAWCRVKPPEVPATLHPAADQGVFLKLHATGVQIYQCTSKPEDTSTFAWTLQAPEATLADRWGHTVGRHYVGPTWELRDGSRVVGEVAARDPGPDPTAIAWVLLRVKSTAGSGALTKTQSVLRVDTVGGIAPSTPCTEAQAHAIARVPYSGDYYFYSAQR